MLRDCLEGLLAQTCDPARFEVIVVDGASTEPVEALVADLAARAPFPLRYLRLLPDAGPVPKRNHGADHARGAVLAFTDSDCRPVPGWLAAGLAAFGDPATASRIGFASGPVTYKPEQPRHAFSKLTAETLVEHPTYPTANAFYRRDLFLEHGGFDTTLSVRDLFDRATECADTDLAWRLRKAGWKNRFVPEALVHHEVEDLTPFQWIMEPSRLILLPLLVRLHPEIAPELLRWNLVFYPGSLAVWAAAAYTILALLLAPNLLWALPAGLAALALRRARSLNPAKLAKALALVIANIARMTILATTLLAGSIRYGRPVL
jgi:glycosyltransferase involved in cell wall biosynthesis